MQEMEQLIEALTMFIQEYERNPESEQKLIYAEQVGKAYFVIKNNGMDLFGWLDREFANDTEMYLLIMSYMIFLFVERDFLDKVDELLCKDDIAWDYTMNIYKQTIIMRFANPELNFAIPYERDRKLWKHMITRFRQEIGFTPAYVPYEQRNHKRIILSTDTLLSEMHAPTAMVLEFYRILCYELGYEVFLLVNVENSPRTPEKMWLMFYDTNYDTEYQHDFARIYQGKYQIAGFQEMVNEANFYELPSYVDMIRKWNPECILHIGGRSVMAEVLGDMVTLLSMPCTSGYAVSDAQVLVGYLINENVEQIKKMQQYVDQEAQKRYDIKFVREHKGEGNQYQAKDFGFPEDAFIVAVVGNRLETEISTEFIGLMERIAKREEKIYYLFIGNYSKDFGSEILEERTNKYGFCTDLLDVLKGTHIFLNPKRQGGGGGAARALTVGVPVITLPDCDVAEVVGDAFLCDSYEEMEELVIKYCNNSAFYQVQQLECEKQHKKRAGIDNVEEIKKLIEQAEKWMQEGAVR